MTVNFNGQLRGAKNFQTEIESSRRFFKNLSNPKFNGLMIFGSSREHKIWLDRYLNPLLDLRGTYKPSQKTITFPWGAKIILQVMEHPSDVNRIRGIELSHFEVDSFDPFNEAVARASEIAMLMKRIDLDKKS